MRRNAVLLQVGLALLLCAGLVAWLVVAGATPPGHKMQDDPPVRPSNADHIYFGTVAAIDCRWVEHAGWKTRYTLEDGHNFGTQGKPEAAVGADVYIVVRGAPDWYGHFVKIEPAPKR
jgi:hypothetical protein